MTNALGAKPVVDTSEFKARLREMNADLRVLESGFRASTASMGDWAASGTGLEMRIKSLNAQMDVQRQKVGLLRSEYERIKAEKGEDAAATKNAEVALNKAIETLGKMENELGQTESALNAMGEETEETGEKAEEAGGKWEGFKTVLGGVGAVAKGVVMAVMGMVAAVAAVAAAVTGLVFSSASAAAELVDLSAKTGISTTALQEMRYIGEQVGVSLDTIATSQARLTRSMSAAAEGTKASEDAFKALGVAVENSDGTLRNQQDVMADVLAALGGIDNAAERDALAMQIFGRSAMELNPLIGLSADEMARMTDEAHRMGAVMSEEDVAALEAFDDTLSALKLGLQGTLGTLATAFLPTFQLVFGTIGGYLERFTRIVDTFTDKGGGIANFTAGLTGLVKDIATDISNNLPQMLQSGLMILKTILDGIIQSLPVILPVVIELLLTLVDFIVQNLAPLLDAALQIVIALTNGLAQAAPTLVPAIVMLIGEIIKVLIANAPLLLQAGADLIAGIAQGLVNAVPQTAKDSIEKFLTQLAFALINIKRGLLGIGKDIVAGVWEGIKSAADWFYQQVFNFFLGIVQAAKDALGIESPAKAMFEPGVMTARGFALGMMSEFNNLDKQMSAALGSLNFAPAYASGSSSVVNNNGSSITINGFSMPNGGPTTTIADIMEFLNRRN